MNTSQLVRLVTACRPSEVPQLLVEQLPSVMEQSYELSLELLALPDSAQRLVASTWLAAVDATSGAFWRQQDQQVVLSEFGANILHETSLWPVDAAGTTPVPGATEQEYALLSARLRRHLDEPDTESFFVVVLAWLVCVALRSTPQSYAQIRHNLSVTALRLVTRLSTLQRDSHSDESGSLIATNLALHAAAAEGFSSGTLEWGKCQLSWAGALEGLYDTGGSQAELDEALYRYEQASKVLGADSLEGLACQFMFEKAMLKRHGSR